MPPKTYSPLALIALTLALLAIPGYLLSLPAGGTGGALCSGLAWLLASSARKEVAGSEGTLRGQEAADTAALVAKWSLVIYAGILALGVLVLMAMSR